MQIIILSGFLGSGKTTVLLELGKYITEVRKETIAIVENEIGKIGIDDKFIENNGYQVKSLYAGCICCTMVTNLVECVIDLKDKNFDWIIIETTGVAYPDKVYENIEKYAGIKGKIVSIADAERWKKLHAVAGELLTGQIKAADIVLINKIDLINDDELNQIKDQMRLLNKEAYIYGISAKNKENKDVCQRITE